MNPNNQENQVNLRQSTQVVRKASIMNKNNLRRYSVLAFILFVALFFTACQTTSAPIPQVSSVAITAPASTTLKVAETLTLTATVTGTSNPSQLVNWESDKPNIASINSSGQVTAIIAGSVTIKATSLADTTKFATITLTVAANAPVGDFSLDLPNGDTSIEVNSTQTVTVTVSPTGGFTSDVALSVSDIPEGITATLSATTITGGTGSSTLTITVDASYNGPNSPRLKVTGTSGTLSDSGFVSLNILPEE